MVRAFDPSLSLWQRWGAAVYRRPGLQLALLLGLPLLWFLVVYVGSLATLLVQSFFTFDDFTMEVTRDWTLDNYRQLLQPANYDVVLRTVLMSIAVTVASAVLAFPLAYYMVRYARGWQKGFFYVAVMLPMWASYIVKVYAWTVLLAKDGIIYWLVGLLGLSGPFDGLMQMDWVGGNSLATSHLGRFAVFTYIWLPFMILPVQAALERVPGNLLQASSDLGASGAQTFRHVILPLAIPGVVAGSIFTFSLTLGDYIIPQLIGPSGLFIGSMVYTMQGSIGNLPLAAAFTVVPVVIIALYLTGARKLGAFDAL
ncbi:ABC transporter permease [Aquabacterium sp.]|uniref:ABC transporter permease n=1 Tax=Aquabacterium sp. TaxID=1872578 RepID=UPI0035AD88D1